MSRTQSNDPSTVGESNVPVGESSYIVKCAAGVSPENVIK